MSYLNHLQVAQAHSSSPNSPSPSPYPPNLLNQSNVGPMNPIVEAAIVDTNLASYMLRYNHPVATSENTHPVFPPSILVNTTGNRPNVCADGVSSTKDNDGSTAEDFMFNTKK